MRSTLTVCLTALALGAVAAQAAPAVYKDPEARFVVTVPDGWTTKRMNAEHLALAIAAPDAAPKGGVCYVAVRDMPQTRDAKQDELDEAFTGLITTDFWKNLFTSAGVSNVAIKETGARTQRHRKVFHVVATVTAADEKGEAKEATGRQEVHPVPGSLQFVQCVAAKEDYAAVEPQFTQVFASYEPKVNQIVAQAPSARPSVLTLSADAGAPIAATVIAQNTPNVPALNGAVAMGVSVAGAGEWEVCEDVNYGGRCNVVTAGAAVEQRMRVGSVRRYLGEGLRSALTNVTSAEVKSAVARMASSK